AEVKNSLADWYRTILQSAYFDWLGEYDTINVARPLRIKTGVSKDSEQKIRRGSFKTTVQIKPSVTSTPLQDADVFAELTRQIDAGVLPPPADDGHSGYRTLYMIDFPSGTSILAPGGLPSCPTDPTQQGFCGYHGAGVYKGKNLAYGVHPDLGVGVCA